METTKPVLSVRAALQTLLDQIDYTRGACGPTEVVSAVLPQQVIEIANVALAAPFGLTVDQESKYTVNDFGRLINRETGAPIPDDEPVMILRAKDELARVAVRKYADTVAEEGGTNATKHAQSCFARYQRFVDFAERYRWRMKKPD
ncbi:MAG: hypothetical protein JWM53_5861 [bacterium]|nr:hypothetical protein [bacterium]